MYYQTLTLFRTTYKQNLPKTHKRNKVDKNLLFYVK